MRPPKPDRGALLGLCVGLALGLFAAEGATRYWVEQANTQRGELAWNAALHTPEWLEAEASDLRWRLPPGEGHNSLGLKNSELGPPVPGRRRILFLGDSLLYHSETGNGQTVPHRVAAQITAGGEPTEGINAGVPGYTTWQEHVFLTLHGLAMSPDEVVLCFVFNDVFSPYLHRAGADLSLPLEPRSQLDRFDTESFPGRLLADSVLAHELMRLSEGLGRRLGLRPSFDFETMPDQWLAWQPHVWRRVETQLSQMQSLLASRGISMRLVSYPVREQFEKDSLGKDDALLFRPQRELRRIAETLGLPHLDLTDSLREAGGAVLFTDYVHLDTAGNEAVAAAVGGWLQADRRPVPYHRGP